MTNVTLPDVTPWITPIEGLEEGPSHKPRRTRRDRQYYRRQAMRKRNNRVREARDAVGLSLFDTSFSGVAKKRSLLGCPNKQCFCKFDKHMGIQKPKYRHAPIQLRDEAFWLYEFAERMYMEVAYEPHHFDCCVAAVS